MSSIKLDLKHFKHHKSDDKSTTLVHEKDGHTITLAHKALSPLNKEQLSALSKLSKSAERPVDRDEAEADKQARGPQFAKGGKVQQYAEGTDFVSDLNDKAQPQAVRSEMPQAEIAPDEVPAQDPNLQGMKDLYNQKLSSMGMSLNKEDMFGPNGEAPKNPVNPSIWGQVENSSQAQRDVSQQVQKRQEISQSSNVEQKAQADHDKALAQNSVNSKLGIPLVQDPGAPQIAKAPMADQTPVQADQAQQAPVGEQQAPKQKQQPQVAQPQQVEQQPQQPPQSPETMAQQAIEQHKQTVQNELLTEDKGWEQDLASGHIEPKTMHEMMYDGKSTLGKIGTIFGMMLAGAGAGLTHTENPMLQIMQKQIDNDLAAQIKSKDNAQTYLKLNREHQLNQAQMKLMGQQGKLSEAEAKNVLVDANTKAIALTRMQMNRAALQHLVEQVKQMPVGSQQRSQAEQTLAMMYQQVNNENYNIADRAAAASAMANYGFGQPSNTNNTDTAQETQFQQQNRMLRMSGNEQLAKDREAKHFPGLQGQASRDLSGEDHSFLQSGTQFQRQMDDFINWTRKHSGSLSPTDIKEGKALAADLQGSYRQATKGGVYKEGEQNFINKLIDTDPTKFFNSIRVIPSLRAISDDNRKRINQYAKNLGFQGYNGAQHEAAPQSNEIERIDPTTGKTVIFDATTKKPLRWK